MLLSTIFTKSIQGLDMLGYLYVYLKKQSHKMFCSGVFPTKQPLLVPCFNLKSSIGRTVLSPKWFRYCNLHDIPNSALSSISIVENEKKNPGLQYIRFNFIQFNLILFKIFHRTDCVISKMVSLL